MLSGKSDSDAEIMLCLYAFRSMNLHFPDGFRTLVKGSYTPAQLVLQMKGFPRSVSVSWIRTWKAFLANDSILTLRYLDEAGWFHAATAATRYERVKWYMFMWFHRGMMQTMELFLGNLMNDNMLAAFEQVSLYLNFLFGQAMMLYQSGYKSRFGLQDFIKDVPRPGT